MDVFPYACFENSNPRGVEDLGYFGERFAFSNLNL